MIPRLASGALARPLPARCRPLPALPFLCCIRFVHADAALLPLLCFTAVLLLMLLLSCFGSFFVALQFS